MSGRGSREGATSAPRSRRVAASFVRESWRQLRAPLAPTFVILVVVFAGTLAIFATTGLTAASTQRTVDRLNSADGRLIVVADARGDADLTSAAIPQVGALPGVEWAMGVGAAVDLENPDLPDLGSVTGRPWYGTLPAAVVTTTSRPVEPGDAFAAPDVIEAVGLGDHVGFLRSRSSEALVTGTADIGAPLADLSEDVLVTGDPSADAPVIRVYVSVDDVSLIPQVSDAARAILTSEDPSALTVSTDADLALLSADIQAELRQQARATLAALLGAVIVLVAAIQWGRVSAAARDIGRRRALGAGRELIVRQVLINAVVTGAVGAAFGAAAGLAVTQWSAGALPGVGFTASVIVLMVLASVLSALGPAVRAGRVDPARILRVP